jgi:hypothetical protein
VIAMQCIAMEQLAYHVTNYFMICLSTDV